MPLAVVAESLGILQFKFILLTRKPGEVRQLPPVVASILAHAPRIGHILVMGSEVPVPTVHELEKAFKFHAFTPPESLVPKTLVVGFGFNIANADKGRTSV